MTEINLDELAKRDPDQPEFRQALREVLLWAQPVLERQPTFRRDALLERIVEPERVIIFRVVWPDGRGQVQVNRGFRVEMNSALGPYKGGLRFHPSVNLGVMKFLAFNQVFKNALISPALGGAKGGSDFDPRGKSDLEVMLFCQAFMAELFRHLGPDTDIPAGDIGVGTREIGYLFGMYKKLANEFTGTLTGKGLDWGGSRIRPEAAGYGCVYFAAEMLATRGQDLAGKACLVSGAGKVALAAAEKLIALGAKVLTISDSSGYLFDETGLDREKLAHIATLKKHHAGQLAEYVERYPGAVHTPVVAGRAGNPLWEHRAECAFPCATENEINGRDAQNLLANGVALVCEGANMPATPEALALFQERQILYGPGKAANAGGVAVSSLEMAQDSLHQQWSREEVDNRLRLIIQAIHRTCLETAAAYGLPGNYQAGANIAAFVKVAGAMLAQGLV